MKVLLRNPRRELDVAGPITVTALLQAVEHDENDDEEYQALLRLIRTPTPDVVEESD